LLLGVVNLTGNFGGYLIEVLLLRGLLAYWLSGRFIPLLNQCSRGSGGLKSQAHGLFPEAARIVFINSVTGQTYRMNFVRGIAIPSDGGIQMPEKGVAVQLWCEWRLWLIAQSGGCAGQEDRCKCAMQKS
jgi:hypothetical protein